MRGSGLPSASRPSASTDGGDARAAAGDHRLVDIDAGLLEGLRDALGRGEPAILDDLGERHVERARHVAGAQAGARLRLLAGEASGRARVDHLALPSVSAICTSPTMATAPVSISALNLRGGRFTSPASVGRPSAFHAGKPPSRMKTFLAPKMRKVHHTRGAE